MDEKIKSSLDSISFVNHLAIAKRAEIGNIVIEVKGDFSIQDALIVKNILLLLNQAKKLDYVSKPLNIAGWVTIYNKDNAPKPEPIPENNKKDNHIKKLTRRNEADDILDALRYSLVDDSSNNYKSVKEVKSLGGNTVSLSDIHLALNAKDEVKEFIQSNIRKTEEKLPGGIPVSFVEKSKTMTNDELANEYKRGVTTIRRWKRLLKDGEYNESSK